MIFEIRQLIANELTIRKRSSRLQKVGQIELTIGQIISLVAAKVDMNRGCAAARVNEIVGIDGMEEYERVPAGV